MTKLLFILTSILSLYAINVNNNIILKSFFSTNGVKINDYKSYLDDEYFIFANNYLAMKKKAFVRDFDKKTKVILPNYPKAIDYLIKSMNNFNNPISAYEFLYIVDNYYYQKTKELKKLRREAINLLYKKKLCSGFIKYGDELKKEKKFQKALQILNQAKNYCKYSVYKKVLPMKIMAVKYQLKSGNLK